MIPRTAAETLKILARDYPMVAVTGLRRSGKTTLVRAALPQKPYASLEDPNQREFAQDDPRRFLGRFADGAVLDEAGSLRPIEIKSGQTLRREHLAGLKKWCDLAGREDASTGRAALVYGGDEPQQRSAVDIVPWADINSLHAPD